MTTDPMVNERPKLCKIKRAVLLDIEMQQTVRNYSDSRVAVMTAHSRPVGVADGQKFLKLKTPTDSGPIPTHLDYAVAMPENI